MWTARESTASFVIDHVNRHLRWYRLTLFLLLALIVGYAPNAHAQGVVFSTCSLSAGAPFISQGAYLVNVTGTFVQGTDGSNPIACVDFIGNGPLSCVGEEGCLSNAFVIPGARYVEISTTNSYTASVMLGFAQDICTVTYTFVNIMTESSTINITIPGSNPTASGCPTSSTSNPGIGPTGTSTNPQSCCGDPISTGNGNYYYSRTDLSVFDHIPNLPLVFQRSYNSLDNYNGPLGNNWTHNFNVILFPSSAGATVKWGDGHGDMFTLTNGAYAPAPGVTNTLAFNSSTNQYTVTRKDGVAYVFTSAGSLISITNPNGLSLTLVQGANSNLAQIICTGCPGSASLSLTYNQNNLISSIADSTGRTVSYAYDTNGNLISETDPAGNVTQYAYDSSNRLISVTLPNGSVPFQNSYDSMSRVISQTNARGYTTTLAYNTPQPMQTTITDPLGNNTTHAYDLFLRIIGITDALGHTTSFAYDANNNVNSVTDARGNTSHFSYDAFGNILSSTDPLGNTSLFTYNSFSEPLTITTPKGNTSTLAYDASGDLTEVEDAVGNQSSFTYNGYGQLTSATDARKNTTNFSYGGVCLTGVIDALGNQSSFVCDPIGRLTAVTDANKHTSAVAYDLLNRIVAVTDALGNSTQFGYDSVNDLTSVTDANQHATLYGYDPVGNLVQVTNALGHQTNYAYDKNNNRISFTNSNGKVTSYGYDAANRLVLVTDPLSFSTSDGLDQDGNVISLTDANGKLNTFMYDADNRRTNASYSDGTTVAYTYDADSNRTTMLDSHGTTSYAYDALDRPLSIVFPGTGPVQYSYDPVGNRASLTYPDNATVMFAHDADNRLSDVTDWKGRETAYSYDPASNLIGMAFPNTATTALTYDAANRLTGISDFAGRLPYRTFKYTLDKVGNRLAIFDTLVTTDYTYDAVNELLTAQLGPLKESWTYDPVGNRTSGDVLGSTINYTYDADDRMLTAGHIQLTYDDNGNRLTYGATKYAYDANNRLLSVEARTGISTFSYDGDGNRFAQATPSGVYDYVNDTAATLPVVLNEKGPNGDIDYAYGQGLTESSSSAFDYFYSLDGLGSVSDLTDATGKVQGTYSYDSWGNALITIGGTRNEFRFTGQALDPATDLYFMRARYYEPTTGRFLTRDGAPGIMTQPITLNRYIYVGNNPFRFSDPSGLNWVPTGQTQPWASPFRPPPLPFISLPPFPPAGWTPSVYPGPLCTPNGDEPAGPRPWLPFHRRPPPPWSAEPEPTEPCLFYNAEGECESPEWPDTPVFNPPWSSPLVLP